MGEKSIDTLVEDIYGLFQTGADVPPEDADMLGKAIAKSIRSRLSQAKEEREEYLRLSNVGRAPVHLWYLTRGYEPEPMAPHTHLKFLIGDICEEVLLFLAKVAGHTVEGEQDEIEIGGVLGHRDAIVDGVTGDVKSASKYSFNEKFKARGMFNPGGDGFGYIPQLAAYCQGKTVDPDAAQPKTKDGFWLTMNKETGELNLTMLHSMEQPNMDDLVAEVKAMVADDTPPPPPEGAVVSATHGNMKLSPIASYDSMKWHIWPNLRCAITGSGPDYLTHVEKWPRRKMYGKLVDCMEVNMYGDQVEHGD